MISINFFKENGFFLFQNVLTHDEVLSFRKESENLFMQKIDSSIGDSEVVKNCILDRSNAIRNIFLQKKIINLIEEICGKGFIILPEVSLMKSQYGGWHKDTTSIELFDQTFHKHVDFNLVNVAIYLQDNNKYGGGLDVVPGSHLTADSYVEYYKNLNKYKSSFLRTMINFFRKKLVIYIKFCLHKIGFLYNKTQNIPLDSEDSKFGKLSIPSKKGDVIIFDLRLDHKASWPQELDNINSAECKYAFFAICGSNNEQTLNYLNYLYMRSEKQEAYNYLKKYKPSSEFIKMASSLNVQLT